jgi:hypothetical protein
LERKFGIAAFDYWWGYSSCQIDLMMIDQPVINYGSGKKSGLGNSREDKAEADALADAWAAKKAAEGDITGRNISLSEYLGEKI